MKLLLSILGPCMWALPLLSQYASHQSTPDPDQPKVVDFSDWSYKLSTTINQSDLKEHIYTLAADDMKGRETGTPGNNKAAAYIGEQLDRLGLPSVTEDGYYQPVSFTFSSFDKLTLHLGQEKYRLLRDFIAFPQYSSTETVVADEITFLGYGIHDASYSDYDIDVTDKVIMVYDSEPLSADRTSYISGSSEPSKWAINWQHKSKLAREKGAKMLIIVSNNLQQLINENRRDLVNRVTQLGDFSDIAPDGVNTIFLSSVVAHQILGDQAADVIQARNMIKTGKMASMTSTIPIELNSELHLKKEVLTSQNVLGFIEGTDLKDEIVIVSAHYDHVGTKGAEVYNGADDNASGSTALLEIAEALATAKKLHQSPRRSVLCLWMTGEEKGLLGSEYYAAQPIWPLDQTMVDVNIDMVGRWGEEYMSKTHPYVYVIGSDRLSQDLHTANEEINQKYSHLLLDYKYNDAEDPNRFYFRSDHYNFAKNGIPSIFFFNGVHEDYHRLTDTPEKIDLGLLQKRTRHIFHLVWSLAHRDQGLEITSPDLDQ